MVILKVSTVQKIVATYDTTVHVMKHMVSKTSFRVYVINLWSNDGAGEVISIRLSGTDRTLRCAIQMSVTLRYLQSSANDRNQEVKQT